MEIHTFNKDRERVRVGLETMAKYVGLVVKGHPGALASHSLAVLWGRVCRMPNPKA